ncbi:hypothetical protein RESH_03290 [Rhodopirellula europaea SH398]|uniref:Uncharacterized protein n=1 Tax=Rhodopirellula europaea SH398 TaxID=1263868 RepID=M5SIU6_9BACT|nr:hypothetical protein RESH_03290 [Rhodopirellula europaea SH398]
MRKPTYYGRPRIGLSSQESGPKPKRPTGKINSQLNQSPAQRWAGALRGFG